MHPLNLSLKQIADQGKFTGLNEVTVRNQLKEVLQDHLLQAIYSSEEANYLVFVGGTALRKLYQLKRMSEDLDFTTDKELDLEALGKMGTRYFQSIRYSDVGYAVQQSEKVRRVTFKFPILFELGLSHNVTEKLFVKIEIPLPAPLAQTQTTIYHANNFSFPIRHETLESLMAGKIAACLKRVWRKGDTGIIVKGRDYYDLIWYMEQKIQPDMVKLDRFFTGIPLQEIFEQLDQRVGAIKVSDLLLDLEALVPDYNYIKSWCQNFHQQYDQCRRSYAA